MVSSAFDCRRLTSSVSVKASLFDEEDHNVVSEGDAWNSLAARKNFEVNDEDGGKKGRDEERKSLFDLEYDSIDYPKLPKLEEERFSNDIQREETKREGLPWMQNEVMTDDDNSLFDTLQFAGSSSYETRQRQGNTAGRRWDH